MPNTKTAAIVKLQNLTPNLKNTAPPQFAKLSNKFYVVFARAMKSYVCICASEEIRFADTPTTVDGKLIESAVLQCIASATPQPTVSWRFRDTRITPGTAPQELLLLLLQLSLLGIKVGESFSAPFLFLRSLHSDFAFSVFPSFPSTVLLLSFPFLLLFLLLLFLFFPFYFAFSF